LRMGRVGGSLVRRAKRPSKRGVSSTAVVGAVVAVVLVAGVAFFLLKPASSSASGARAQSATGAPPPGFNVTQAYLAHIDEFANRTACAYSATCVYSFAALNDYTNQSTVSWVGHSRPISVGTFSGLANIQSLYQTVATVTSTMRLHVLSVGASGDQLNLVMNVTGTSESLGNYAGTVRAQASYAYANGAWSISREVWNYTYFASEFNGSYQPYPSNYA